MKTLFTFLAVAFICANVLPQSPEKMSYQAVVRNSSDVLITNTQIGMQISILQGTAAGSPVYTETQTPTTNANGLVSIEIGDGATSDDFSAIDWSAGPYFIKTETDPAGSTNYTITGVSQLLSVPYALHAKTAEALIEAITETDPVFTAWDKSAGISITESQISDLGTYLETESDPVFTAWDKSTDIAITKSQITDLGSYVETESDPVFTAWDKSAGVSITKSQISDLGTYLETESDPVFTAWDKSTDIAITKSQITDLGSYVETESDPVFTAWDKSAGVSITESQISDLGTYLETEIDPEFTSSEAANITATDITNLGNLSGTNTGDQDITGIAINEQAIKDTALQIRADIPDVSGFVSSETDPQVGTNTLNYLSKWDGSALVSSTIFDNGNVGIGTTNPTASLDVRGKVYAEGTSQFGTFTFLESSDSHEDVHESLLSLQNKSGIATSQANIQFAAGPEGHGRAIISATRDIPDGGGFYDGKINFKVRNGTTSYITALSLRSSGNVGINTSDPDATLHVNGDAHITGDLIVDGATTGEIILDNSINDLSGTGMMTYGTVDANATGIGAALYMASDGNYEEANAGALATMPCVAIALETGTGDKKVLLQGNIRNDTWTWAPGGMVYVSLVTGTLTQTRPSATGEQVQIVGYATSANTIFFNPNLMLIEIK